MVKVAIIGLAGGLLAVYLKNHKSEYSLYVILGVAILIFTYICTQVKSIITAINSFATYINIDSTYITILINVTGISYLSEFASSICRDLAYHSISSQIEVFSRLTLFVISIPVVTALIETIGRL